MIPYLRTITLNETWVKRAEFDKVVFIRPAL